MTGLPSFDTIFHFQGNVGPFVSGLPTEVPLWLAINLRQRLKCEIVLPDWLSVGEYRPPVFSEKSSFLTNINYYKRLLLLFPVVSIVTKFPIICYTWNSSSLTQVVFLSPDCSLCLLASDKHKWLSGDGNSGDTKTRIPAECKLADLRTSTDSLMNWLDWLDSSVASLCSELAPGKSR